MKRLRENYSIVADDSDSTIYTFCPEPCCPLAVEGNEEWVKRYISDDFADKESFLSEYEKYSKKFRQWIKEKGERWHIICASNTLEHFAKTGYINEFSKQFVSSFPKEMRAAMIRKWQMKAESYNVYSVKEKVIPDTSSLCVFSSRQKAILVLTNEQRNVNIQISVAEPSIVGLIYAYLEKLEHECAMGKEEYREFINGLIKSLMN